MRLKDRVAIVTGAARGIGQAYGLALAREGSKVVAADILPCTETVAKVQDAGGEALGVTVDVADAQSTEAMAAQTVQRFGRIDILVNNAAVYGGLKLTPFEQIPEAEWDRVMAVNVKGIWLCCKAVIPTMKQQGKGKIINISSDTIWMGVRTEAAQGLADPETVARIREWVLDQQIIKRHEEPADLTGTVVFLASDDSDFITGQTINVNGGATHH